MDELLAMVSLPETAPALVGLNCTFRVAVEPGLTVKGKVAPVTENPAPVAVALLTVTAEPEAMRPIDCVEGVFTITLPKEMLVALILSVPADDEEAGFKVSEKVFEMLFAEAVRVTDFVEVTAATVVENPTLAALAGTVTDAGTVAEALLLARATVMPPDGAAALSVTVQASLPAADMEALWQTRPVSDGSEGGGVEAEGLSDRENDCVVPPPLAVRIIVCEVVTAAAVAVKPTLVAFTGTVTEEGTVSAALLLASPTLKPPEGAAELRVAVQESVPVPVIDDLAHERAVTEGVAVPLRTPLPCSFTLALGTCIELLVMFRLPVSSAAAAGP